MAGLVSFRPERPADGAVASTLIERAFGPGRYAKAAERLREGAQPLLELSVVAWSNSEAVGCVRLWPVSIGHRSAILLGPIAVEAAWRGRGVGRGLVGHACAAAAKEGHPLMLLVGDESYFGPLGFSARPARLVVMPGPVDQRRVLIRASGETVIGELSGRVSAGNTLATPPSRQA